MAVTDTKIMIANAQVVAADTQEAVTDTKVVVADTHAMVADIHQKLLAGQQDTSAQNRPVGQLVINQQHHTYHRPDSNQVSDA